MNKLALLLPALALAACASSPGPAQSSTINGIDLWQGGLPTRPYQVIATVSRQGADGSATYAEEEQLLAADAHARGADAVIILDTVMVVSRLDVTDGRPIMAPKVDAQLIKYQ